MKREGFTLLETLLAIIVFSMAVVALVEAVHQLGENTLQRQHEAAIQERMRSILLEQTRIFVQNPPEEMKIKEGLITYTVRRTPLELSDRNGQAIQGIFEVSVTADWMEGRTPQQASTETWLYPPLFQP
ncbi:type II secretion system protein [Prosthecobacter vanneervenii]|uniref:Prepilin-type N-terminal cleavage/methylation domain-containing protein n=1 Tax=Prosthecobacter vanneervenii TaxID=48466 RepID=A0A7W7Y7B0_9BACT|nr:type II secretion system protein [Prosthecobacter vanneervenii]MBB5030946.1 prepilin-type N-terminal cleavage/methylation domain-containing protein [Prosthecobacter vanneervenii]